MSLLLSERLAKKRIIILRIIVGQILFLLSSTVVGFTTPPATNYPKRSSSSLRNVALSGWVQQDDGEWAWEEDDPNYVAPVATASALESSSSSTATPQLPSGSYKPKQSLGQNYLKDPNTVAKILRTFHSDATRRDQPDRNRIVELGPGAGALTDRLVEMYQADQLQVIEIDQRSVNILKDKHPDLRILHADVLQVDYEAMANQEGQPLVVIGNLPYYITSQILFALADASHSGSVYSATVTMQWEVGQRMVATTSTKDYGILSVVFQLYAHVKCHYKIPPTVFYPQPKVDSALVGLHFLGPSALRERLAGVQPAHLRRIVTTAFRQRRKTLRNSLKKLFLELCGGDAQAAQALSQAPPLPLPDPIQRARDRGDPFALKQELPSNWATKRPEELSPGQFVELTRLAFGPQIYNEEASKSAPLGRKVWRKLKHGLN